MVEEGLVRSFLAIDLPDEIKDRIAKIQESLKSQIGGIRWTMPEGIHLTLKFFGDISRDEISAISEAAEQASSKIDSFSLSIEGLGVFPGLKRPRVLWIGMGGELEKLRSLQEDIEASLDIRGFNREERTFKPHLTLGRFRSPAEASVMEGALEKKGGYQAGSFAAQGLTLFKSDLTSKGAVYTALKVFSFGHQ